ncbi:MAG: hypothetical protein M3285_07995 [Actinomycetota bacterium]|nr:hypothetical protein [Actinomycetota bacterium]
MLNKRAIRWISIGLALALAILAVVAVTSSVSARSKPPPALLRYNGETIQRGNLGTYCWSSGRVGECVDTFGYSFPHGVWVPKGARVAIRLEKDEKPARVEITAWRKVDDDGQPVGDGRGLRKRLVPVGRGGDVVAWEARLRLRRGGRHYYMSTFVKWNDKGDAFYDFHAKTRGELTCAGWPVTLTGGPNADELVGTAGDDVIVARGGADVIKGLGGDDRICGGGGKDRSRGGRGADRILSRKDDDTTFGGRGRDRLRGGSGPDDLRGGPGRDVCSGADRYRGCEIRTIRID